MDVQIYDTFVQSKAEKGKTRSDITLNCQINIAAWQNEEFVKLNATIAS